MPGCGCAAGARWGLREALTPDYEPLCKRQVISGTYYSAMKSRNAELVTDGSSKSPRRESGQRTDGIGRADVIVLATGFQPHNYMRPMEITGRDGLTSTKHGPADRGHTG